MPSTNVDADAPKRPFKQPELTPRFGNEHESPSFSLYTINPVTSMTALLHSIPRSRSDGLAAASRGPSFP